MIKTKPAVLKRQNGTLNFFSNKMDTVAYYSAYEEWKDSVSYWIFFQTGGFSSFRDIYIDKPVNTKNTPVSLYLLVYP